MLLNGGQPSRSRLRLFLFAAIALVGLIFIWSTSGPDGTQLTDAISSWPAAVASQFSADDDGSGDVNDVPSGGGRKYDEPIPPPWELPPTTDNTDKGTTDKAVVATDNTDKGTTDKAVVATDAPYFVLIGDSTTCGQANNGGGWGDAFLWALARGAEGVNHGVNGALSTGYFHSPTWVGAMEEVRTNAPRRSVYVTIQFGHNDQMPNSNVTLDMYQDALVGMAREVRAAGGTPVLVTPLARRDFDPDGTTVTDNLKDYRERTQRAHEVLLGDDATATDGGKRHARLVNLNAASLAYIGAIGKTAAFRYNKWYPFFPDTTHLNELGAIVFARIVADLLLGHPPTLIPSGEPDPWSPGEGNDDDGLSGWIKPDPYLTGLVWHGDAI